MFFAIDENENIVIAENAKKDEKYFCPMCKAEVRLRSGKLNAPHFAHESLEDCDDFLHDTSEWHRKWQSLFPRKNCEYVIRGGNEIHRADVCCYGTVIEFQYSRILYDEFWRRNNFYTEQGYKVVWIFDVTDIYEKDDSSEGIYVTGDWETAYDNGTKFRWKRPWRFLADFLPQNEKNIDIFLQIVPFGDNPKEREACYMEKVVWVNPYCKTAWGCFHTSNKSAMNYVELLGWLRERWEKEQRR